MTKPEECWRHATALDDALPPCCDDALPACTVGRQANPRRSCRSNQHARTWRQLGDTTTTPAWTAAHAAAATTAPTACSSAVVTVLRCCRAAAAAIRHQRHCNQHVAVLVHTMARACVGGLPCLACRAAQVAVVAVQRWHHRRHTTWSLSKRRRRMVRLLLT